MTVCCVPAAVPTAVAQSPLPPASQPGGAPSLGLGLNASDTAPASPPKRLTQAESAQLLIQSALLRGVWGPPVHCLIAQEISVLDRRLLGSGEYWRGQSLGETKMNLKIVAGDHLNILHQVSNGRICQTIKNIDGTREGSRVELERVWKYLGRFDDDRDRNDPLVALHLAIGGQNEKLRALCQQYQWTQVQSGKFTQPGSSTATEVWWLRGIRNVSPPTFRGLAEIDSQMISDSANLLPDQATIAIGRTAPLQYWLYHVEETRQSPSSDRDSPGKLVFKIDFYQPTIVRELPANLFENSENSTPEIFVDETRKYKPPNRAADHQTASRLP